MGDSTQTNGEVLNNDRAWSSLQKAELLMVKGNRQ